MSTIVITLSATFAATLIAFAFLMAVLAAVQRFGKLRSRCSCRRSEEVLKRYDAIHRATDSSQVYDSASVDPSSLPIVE
ncbi:MAG: hypothetical protein ACRC46_02165 [Thermoguttaceae bacterium]